MWWDETRTEYANFAGASSSEAHGSQFGHGDGHIRPTGNKLLIITTSPEVVSI
jgi:hypothetical protein